MLEVSWECVEGIWRECLKGCLNSVRRVSWQCQKGVLSESVSTCFYQQIFYQSGKNMMGHDRVGQFMSKHVRTECFGCKILWPPNNVGLKILLEINLFWLDFSLIKSFFSCPFTLNRSSCNIATLGLHLGFQFARWSHEAAILCSRTHPAYRISLK